ncbi:MAG: HD family phosphohydrolase [Clostridia bacterium]|nr:HD family phosphohydrolase [Clostridia bacterium]
MTKQKEKSAKEDAEFQSIIRELIENETVLQMNNFMQHYDTNCFSHCYTASYYCYILCKKLGLDYKSAAKGAMLHDLFLYNWREKGDRKGLHAFTHGRCAYENASKIFELNDIEKDMIIKHMWPLTVKLPKYKETFILTLVDKYCTIEETAKYYRKKKVFKYAYMLIGGLLLKFTK